MSNNLPLHLITVRTGAVMAGLAGIGALASWWRVEHPAPGIDIIPVLALVIFVYSGLLGLLILMAGIIWGGIRRMMVRRRSRMNTEGRSTTTEP